MEEVGAQVAAPIFIHEALSSRYCDMTSMAKKHDLSYQSPNSQLQQHQFLQASREKNWNSKAWDWDSVGFVAKPSVAAETLRLGTVSREPKKKDKSDSKNKSNSVNEDDDGLGLNLGGSLTSVEEPVSRPNKRVRSGSPGNGSYPMCQVDNCKEDLSKAKDYHRRHKVCQVHSKATKALVGKQMQRFCQQCSRFHPLTEFDEGKRSCRRRLAGHNRRRRKTQPEDVTSRLLLPGNPDMNNNGNLDIVNLLTALARSQASAPDALAILSQRSSQSSDNDKSKLPGPNQVTVPHLQKRSNVEFPAVGVERISRCYESPAEDSDYQIQESRPNLPLQLFSSSPENESRQKPASSGKYFSSDSSNPIEERSPSSSPPVVQKLFPLQSTAETMKSEKMSVSREVNANVEGDRSHGCVLPLELFRGPNREPDHSSFQSFPYRGGYTSSSGSDHSPSSQNSDPQDRTGRIIFKLFDKDPSHFPGTLRTKIYNWLSNSPSEMESYIRPGCVVLSVYLSMPSASWEQLERNLLQLVDSLVQDSDSDLWRSGRFLLNTGRQLASHKDGKVRLCKSWRTWSSPELILVSPVAVIGGQETSLQLKGRNLTGPGTKIHCTYMGGYTSKEVTDSSSPGSMYDEINVGGFKIHGPSPSILGRCFIEVENGFKGNSFPVIIADASICKELRLLESEFDENAVVSNIVSEEQTRDLGRPRSREEVMHFLNELGWLFQRKSMPSMHEAPDYSLNRFKFLLIFSVERDYCVLVKTILDMLVERNTCRDELSKEHLEMLYEIQLLNRSVKRRCRKMADLLIHYSIIGGDNSSRTYIFPPNVGGPGGITPLHLAACASGSDGLVDALTNDPHEIGLSCWNSVLDANGLSPYAYAVMTKNHSYNLLVARKLADKRNGQISVAIGNEIEQAALEQEHVTISQFQRERKSCAKCASVAAKMHGRFLGSQGLLQRPYVHSMLAIAAVCVCVCLFFRGAPDIGLVAPFKWENLNYGTI
ncbi:hypothetical protein POPTR_002G002400v4 [Populus trichocarpa]|uniref:SBP-type domain-containing protein n=1 Tax=Populus trichocarpa TaxID=3694 RepID=A0A2K2BB76_POPTR|nr:squamosa promoter-binding-like protein 14 isoform X2 [Populus trichocarpa]KAI5596457.1 hypothetical protein BDE02_02G002200 [Populus trichocarpa]PNT47032.1 hypothetical protein POPTR_002G002400v4 [Populus trichocarpa]|eukprot:XP_024450223.1 squamosa promoter-binding-like protein 14 isoform X2 [Populus trichocarpa]